MFESSPIAADVSGNGTHDITAARPRPLAALPQRIASGALLGGGKELVIEHAGQEYHLRLTRNDKLILTK